MTGMHEELVEEHIISRTLPGLRLITAIDRDQMPAHHHFFHRADRILIGETGDRGNDVIHGTSVIGQEIHPMEPDVGGIEEKENLKTVNMDG